MTVGAIMGGRMELKELTNSKRVLVNKKSGLGYALLAVISVAVMEINFENTVEDGAGVIYAVLSSFSGWGIGEFLAVIGLWHIYYYIYENFRFQKLIAGFSIILSLMMVMGLCYRNATGIVLLALNLAQVFKAGLVVLGYSSLFYCAIFLLEIWMHKLISEQELEESNDGKMRYEWKIGLFLFLCWLPYLIVLYPGTTLYDTGIMLKQFFGYEPLTNHHPYFQILFVGFFVKIGNALGSGAAGMFAYVLIQECAFIAVLSYMLGLLRKIGIGKKIRIYLIGIYAFLPVFPVYAFSVGKNINFSIVVLLLTIFMFEVIRSADEFVHNRVKMILLSVLLILICLFRNEGLAIVLGCFPFFVIVEKKYRKLFGGIFAGVLLCVLVWFKGILPLAGVANGSIAESLSIPFMQTARSVYYYGNEMTEEEKAAIDKVLEFDTLSERYLPEFADRVKEKYNNDATEEEIEAYLKVYWQQLLAHPVTYVDAVLNKSYGYFYPDDKGKTKAWFVVGADVSALNEDGFDLYSRFPGAVKWLERILEAFREVPLLGYTTSIGFYSWGMFLAMFFIGKSREKRYLSLFIPALIVLLVCVASPVNAYFRYGLPIVFAVPFFFAVSIYVMRDNDEKYSNNYEEQ